MRKLLLFFCGMLVGGGLVCFGFKYHVVRSSEGVMLVPKKQAGLSDLYADVRGWTPADWQAHPNLLRSIMAHGRGDLIGGPDNDFLRDLIRKFNNAEKVDDELRLE